MDIVKLETRAKRRMPVNVTPTDAKYRAPRDDDTHYVHGEHEPHWWKCPDAPKFRESKLRELAPQRSTSDWPPEAA